VKRDALCWCLSACYDAWGVGEDCNAALDGLRGEESSALAWYESNFEAGFRHMTRFLGE
jgi:hypothetical protein